MVRIILRGTLFTAGQKIIDFYEQRGQLRQKLSLDKIIDGQFVAAVKESR